MKFIKPFAQMTIHDTPIVGGKNASIGQMIRELADKGITIPDGFAVTADAYWHYLEHNNLRGPITQALAKLTNHQDIKTLQAVGQEVRTLITNGTMPDDLSEEITTAYKNLCTQYGQENCDVAVRSSATAEDLPTASFAGQQETFLNIRGNDHLLDACKKSIASLFTNRAIAYRIEHGFDHEQVALSIGIQKMVRSDRACSGVTFSLDTETGFPDVVMIDASYGLGETIVKGLVTPDEFVVHKPTLIQGYSGIIKKRRGIKETKAVYQDDPDNPITYEPVPQEQQQQFCLTDDEIREIARATITIEEHYSEVHNRWSPMDVEWAKDGIDGKIYIVQARPETIHAHKADAPSFTQHAIEKEHLSNLAEKILVTGQSIGQQITHGTARIIETAAQIGTVNPGDVIVTEMTDPDWVPAMKKAAAIITERGGRTCHAAIVSRELGIPAIVGAHGAMEALRNAQEVTVDCSRGAHGFVYSGKIPFTTQEITPTTIPDAPVPIMLNIADPGSAFKLSSLPVSGVGLARLEFIISNDIGVHPMALLQPEKTDPAVQEQLKQVTAGYPDMPSFFVERLAQGIATIAAAFYPRPVIARLSDFKTNEYRTMLGGQTFEPVEENPMLGFRGASRYTHELFKDAFALECAAFKMVREQMGFTNVKIMVPFVRTVQEAQATIDAMAANGLSRGTDGLEVYMMCEIPSNVLLMDEFCALFDGISIGSNDLTQFTLGVDRDSEIVQKMFDERDPAVKKMLKMAIEGARKNNTPIGLCGQAPSDHPEIADFLIECGIDSISLNPDAVLPFLMRKP